MYKFTEHIKPLGYWDKIDDSLLTFYALTRGSINTLITDEHRIAPRKGTLLFGAAGTSVQGIGSSYTWQTSTNLELNLRFPYDIVQVVRDGVWKTVGSGYKLNNKFRCVPWWNRAEIKDVLLMVNGTASVSSWTGGMTEITSWTTTTVTKKWAKQSQVANNFVFNAVGKTLTQTDTDFITQGFAVDQKVRVLGTTNNNGVFIVRSVTSTVITFSSTDIITNETIATSASVIGVQGRETWANERFSTTGALTVNIGGTIYTYTAGFNTPTLTLTADPSSTSSVGLFVYQPIASNTVAGGDFQTGQLIDLIEILANQIFYSYTQSRNVYITKQSDFKDCGYTATVRKAGEGGTIFLDNNCGGIATSQNLIQITAGASDVYNITFESYSDGVTAGTGENIKVKKLATAYGQGAISPDCFVKIKNGILYISQEGTIDFLGNVEQIATQQTEPISDPIKRFLGTIDKTNAQGIYIKNYVLYIFPNANCMLMYDTERKFWQPPQIIGGNSLTTIAGLPYIHSNTTDETYKLFSGLTDNGKPIARAVYSNINTYGTRLIRKTYDEAFIEILLNGGATNVQCTISNGYLGSTGLHSFVCNFNDPDNFFEVPLSASGLGTSSFGQNSLGSLFSDTTQDPDIGAMKKMYKISNTNLTNIFVQQLQVADDILGSYWEIICYGTNARIADDNMMDLKE